MYVHVALTKYCIVGNFGEPVIRMCWQSLNLVIFCKLPICQSFLLYVLCETYLPRVLRACTRVKLIASDMQAHLSIHRPFPTFQCIELLDTIDLLMQSRLCQKLSL